MASNPRLPKLPDLSTNLFGNLADPTSMMDLSAGAVDIFNIKPSAPLPKVELSAQAQQAIRTAQAQQAAISQQAQQAQQALETQQAQLAESQQKLWQQQSQQAAEATDSYMKEQARLARIAEEERKKALEDKKKEQGGVLGAEKDGSFIMTRIAPEILATFDQNEIKSSLQRRDLIEENLKKIEEDLRKAGYPEDTIVAELKIGRRLLDAGVSSYESTMKADGIDPLDVGYSIVKGVAPLVSLYGAAARDTNALQFGTDLRNAMSEAQSKTMQLDFANQQYLDQKKKSENPDRNFVERGVDFLKTINESGSKLSTLVDVGGALIPGVLSGGAATVGAQGLGRSLAAAGATRLGNVVTKTAPLSATVGVNLAYGGGDAVGNAYESIQATPIDDVVDSSTNKVITPGIRTNFINNYGQQAWDALVAEHNGDLDAVKKDLGVNAGRIAFARYAPLAIITAPFGLEGIASRAIASKSAQLLGSRAVAAAPTSLARKVGVVAGATVAEGIEEGYTTYAGNKAAQPYTGQDAMDGVAEAAALGAVAGGVFSVPFTMLRSKPDSPQQKSFSEFDISDYTDNGTVNTDRLRADIGRVLDQDKRTLLENGMSEAEATAWMQFNYNRSIDNPEVMGRLTPEQKADFEEYLRIEHNIATNPYAEYAGPTFAEQIIKIGRVDEAEATGDIELLNAYRAYHGVDTDKITADKKDYYAAVADAVRAFDASPATNTKERFEQWAKIQADIATKYPNLDAVDLKDLSKFAYTHLDAGMRRFTDAELAEWNQRNANQQNQAQSNRSRNSGNPSDADGEPTASSGNDSAAQGGQPSETMDEPNLGATGGNNPQGAGNDNSRQANDPSGTANPASQVSQDAVDPVGQTASPISTGQEPPTTRAPESDGGQTSQTGDTGPASQARQPVGQLDPNATQAPVSSGGVGATPPELNSTGGSPETSAQVSTATPSNPAIVPKVTRDLATRVFNNLTPTQRRDINRIVPDASDAEALYALLQGTQGDLTARINSIGANKVVARRVQDVVRQARDYALSPERVIESLQVAQRQNSANQDLIPSIAETLVNAPKKSTVTTFS